MKLTKNAMAALQQPDTQAAMVVMTDERKKKFSKVCGQVMDVLKATTDGPVEAYMILQFCVSALEESVGIRGGVIVEHGDTQS